MRANRAPVVTILFIAANFLAAGLLVADPDQIGLLAFQPAHPQLLTAFTCLFLHGNLIHLLGNMVFLAAVGAAVELATGAARFATVYFLSGLAGVGAYLLMAPQNSPLMGASGAIAGCAGYYTARYLNLRVPIAPKVGVSVASVTVLWAGLQLLGAVLRVGDAAGPVSFWAHLGGLAMGLLMSVVFRAPDLGQRRLGHAVLDKMNERSPAAALQAAERHLGEHPKDVRALRQVVDAANTMGEKDKEIDALLKLLDTLPESAQGPAILRLADASALDRLPVRRRLMLAERMKLADPEAGKALLTSVMDADPTGPQWPEAALALVGLLWDTDHEKALARLRELKERFSLHPTLEVARMRGWLDEI